MFYKLKNFCLVIILPLICLLSFNSLFCSNFAYANDEINKEEISKVIEQIYNTRNKGFIDGNLKPLASYYNPSQKYSKWCLEHEVKRVKYLNDWAFRRNIKFTNINSKIKLRKVSGSSTNIKAFLDEIYKFDYVYEDDKNDSFLNSFGITVNHSISLHKKDNKWIVHTDWYTDCFEDALKSFSGNVEKIDESNTPKFKLCKCPKEINPYSSINYNRLQAVIYADKYCGVNWASKNELSHNKKYKNFTGAGGDCTNYVSQSLGDKEAGGLRFDYTWYCAYSKYNGANGSKAFVNANAFRNYIIYSGKGRLISRGKFEKHIKPLENYPNGCMQKLELGDLVCYVNKSVADHFAIVTGFDSHGYPLINSHTTNRYHVPWDLGWGDKNISFHLIHIR